MKNAEFKIARKLTTREEYEASPEYARIYRGYENNIAMDKSVAKRFEFIAGYVCPCDPEKNFIRLKWKRISNPSPVIEYVSLTVGGYEVPAKFVNVTAVRKFWRCYRELLVGGWRPTQSQVWEALREINAHAQVPARFELNANY